jgi:spheroidene monooxygenase
MKQQTAVLSLVNYPSESLAWGLSRFVIGKYALKNIPGLECSKILGSGQNGGFQLRPSFRKQGLLCVFDTPENANKFRENSALIKCYQDHADEFFCVTLQTYSSKGTWSSYSMELAHPPPVSGPIAGITRASIKWHKAPNFGAKLHQQKNR